MRLSLFVAVVVVVGGCTRPNPNYCPGAPDNNCKNVDAGPDAPMHCASSDECTQEGAAVCKLPEGLCVECVDRSTCEAATEPVCDTATNRCVGCRMHADCPGSGACLPDGSCADPAQVAYVSPSGTGNCALGSPCGTLAEALATNLPVVKLIGPGVIDDSKVTVIDRKVTLVADPGALLDRTNDGPILQLGADGNASIYDLQISGAGGSNGDAIVVPNLGGNPTLTLERVAVHSNSHFGLTANSGRVVIRRSVFSGNFGGGANISGADFEITNSMFVANGSVTSTTGGLSLLPLSSAYSFEFNTVADNVSAQTQPVSGIVCTGVTPMADNIISRNQTSATCVFEFSLFDPATPVTGTNVAGDPVFRNRDPTLPTAPTYYRIGNTSAAKDRADPAGKAAVDIDGQQRPIGGGKDIGADETEQ